MLLQELAAPFYSNSSVLSSDLQLLSKKNAFNDMLTVGMLRSQPDVYLIHRCVVQRKTLLSLLVFSVLVLINTTETRFTVVSGQPEHVCEEFHQIGS